MRADSALTVLETAAPGLPHGLPYGVCVGNHDQTPMGDPQGSTEFYNQFFGVGRFAGRGYFVSNRLRGEQAGDQVGADVAARAEHDDERRVFSTGRIHAARSLATAAAPAPSSGRAACRCSWTVRPTGSTAGAGCCARSG